MDLSGSTVRIRSLEFAMQAKTQGPWGGATPPMPTVEELVEAAKTFEAYITNA